MRVLLVFLTVLALRAAAQSTCADLQTLASRASGITCTRNSQCSELQCDVTQSFIRGYIRRATLTLLPCNQPAAVRVVLYSPSNAVIVNRTFDSTATLTVVNGILTVTVTVEHPTSSSLRLGISGRVGSGFFSQSLQILPNTDIALNTSACLSATTAPTVVTSAATTAPGSQATTAPSLSETCRALDTLRDNAQSLSCNRNDQCDTVYCTVTDSTVRAFVSAANLTLLPCNQPPAVRLTVYNPSGGVVLDRVISQSETLSLPQGTTLSVTLNQLTNAIGFGATASATVFGITSRTTLVPYTQIPIDTSGCSTPTSMASPTPPSSIPSFTTSSSTPLSTTPPPTTPPPTTPPPTTPPPTTPPPTTPPSTTPPPTTPPPTTPPPTTPPPTTPPSTTPPSTTPPSTTHPSAPSPTSNSFTEATTNTPTLTTTEEIPQRNMCAVLQQIASRAPGNFECSTNQRCDGVDCSADLLNNGMPLQSRVVILVCQLPRPAVEIILLGPSGAVIVNETVDHSEVLSVQQFLQVNITLDQYQNAIGLQVEATLANNPPIPVIEYTLIPIDTSNCQRPTLAPTSMASPTSPSSIPSFTTSSSTPNSSTVAITNAPTVIPTVDIPQRNMCAVLQQIASRAPGNFECFTNQRCDGVDCSADLLNNGMPFQSRAIVLVCQLPRPAVEIILLGSNGAVIVNETVDHSEILSVQQFLQVNITLDQYQNAIGLQVEATLANNPPVPVIEYTLIPIDTSNCQRPTLSTGGTATDQTTTDDDNETAEAVSAGNPLIAGATVLFLSLLGSGLCTQ